MATTYLRLTPIKKATAKILGDTFFLSACLAKGNEVSTIVQEGMCLADTPPLFAQNRY